MDPTTITLLVVLGLALAVGGILIYRKTRPKFQEPVFHMNCPGCKRRFRYYARQAGRSATCPQCRRQITFPKYPGAVQP
jgi:predicted amidophosphoribosyltransferase